MLYDQIRYAEVIRKLYRLRHLLVRSSHPDLGSRLGYTKYSKQFYRVKRKLLELGILDKQGRFVDNLPNLWLAELPLHANKEQLSILGNQVPYSVFLATIIDSPKKTGALAKELNFNRMAVYKALKKLEKVELVMTEDSTISAKEGELYRELLRYIDLCKTHADATGDISVLFKTIPAYISGSQAYYMIHYQPGRPVGPAHMRITTWKPFLKFWEHIIDQISYFRDYPKDIDVNLAKTTDEIVWIDTLPYNKKASIILEA